MQHVYETAGRGPRADSYERVRSEIIGKGPHTIYNSIGIKAFEFGGITWPCMKIQKMARKGGRLLAFASWWICTLFLYDTPYIIA